MLYPILIGVTVLVVLFLIVVAMQPATFRVSRSTTIAAPPAVVWEEVNDFHKWGAWSPWEKIDPELKRTYEGPSSGVGSVYSWVGNKKVGEGRMTILDSKPGELVRIKLEFMKPYAATNTAEFAFEPQGGQTFVEWSMTGNKNFMMKAMCLFMNMDKMIGPDFEKGLTAMKSVSESQARQGQA